MNFPASDVAGLDNQNQKQNQNQNQNQGAGSPGEELVLHAQSAYVVTCCRDLETPSPIYLGRR